MMDDDIIAQLQRQRRKQQQKQKSKSSSAIKSSSESANAKTSSESTLSLLPTTTQTSSQSHSHSQYYYDSTTKRYYPKSTFYKSNGNNDVCVQRCIRKQQKQSSSSVVTTAKKKQDGVYEHRNNITNDDVQRVVFHGNSTILLYNLRSSSSNDEGESATAAATASSSPSSSGKKRKSKSFRKKQRYNHNHHTSSSSSSSTTTKNNTDIPSSLSLSCTERTIQLLTTSLQYCSNSHTRNTICNALLRPMNIARRGRVVPTAVLVSTLEGSGSSTIRRRRRRKAVGYCMHSSSRGGSSSNEEDHSIILRPYALKDEQQQSSTTTTTATTYSTQHQQQWFSMLHPLKLPQRQHDVFTHHGQKTTPYDCICKSYLQPTACTFDVLHPNSNNNMSSTTATTTNSGLPYMATISNNRIFYRTPTTTAWELRPPPQAAAATQYHAVRLAPYICKDEELQQQHPCVGCIVYDVNRDMHHFILERCSWRGGLSSSSSSSTNNRRDVILPCSSLVNDFCFVPDSTLQDPGIIAFAHSGKTNGASILDVATKTLIGSYDSHSSETLCVQFRKNNDKNQILYGHRNGGLSMRDIRYPQEAASYGGAGIGIGPSSSSSSPQSSFGSTTSIHSLQRDDNLVVMKGSFGSSRIVDLRRLSSNNSQSQQKPSSAATLLELELPDSLHVHRTKSVRCTGLAIDPTENIVVTSFVNEQNEIQFALMDIVTGRLIRTLSLSGSSSDGISGGNVKSNGASTEDVPVFCELSSIITKGYEMIYSDKDDDDDDDALPIRISSAGSSWGLWFKTGSLAGPAVGGGIHHIRF